MSDGATGKEAAFARLLAETTALPLKHRLRLLDALKSEVILEREDGLRFSLESLSEYKRARKRAGSDSLERWLRSFTPTDVLYDIGANTGAVSLLAARLHGGRVPVVAFEPAADTFAALVRNVQANGAADVITPVHAALSDATGIGPFHRASLGAGSALHALGEPLDYARRPFTPVSVEPVLSFRLDDFVRTFALPAPTCLKIDVDGFEDKVLSGAAGALAATCRHVHIELVEAAPGDPHPEQVAGVLRSLGYQRAELVEHSLPGTYPRIVDALFSRA